MPVSFPRAMPAIGFGSQSFELVHQTVVAPTRGGQLTSVELGPARWRGEWQTNTLPEVDFHAYRAWLSSLRGSGRSFYGQDRMHRFPTNYPNGFTGLTRAGTATAFDGTATSWSVDATRATLTLNGLPAALALLPGDYVGFSWSTTKRALVRILEAVTANGSGVAVFDVEPSVPALVPGGAVATLADPTCLMRIEPGSIDASASFTKTGQISFRAVQILEP